MFTEEQVLHYKTFGYVIMRSVFTSSEMKSMQDEYEVVIRRLDAIAPYDGKTDSRHAIVLGDDTPFFAALTEDERLLRPAQQVFGEDAIMWEWHIYQYMTRNGTFWHANDGDPTHGRYLYGARYQWPLFEPVHADTGALRVMPGSHLPEYQWELRKADAAGLLRNIAEVGGVVCEAEVGDVVAFDTRIYHGSAPYDKERRVASGIYLHFPETPRETAITERAFGAEHELWQQWRKNEPDSPFRHRWEQLRLRLKEASKNAGFRLERHEGRPGELVQS